MAGRSLWGPVRDSRPPVHGQPVSLILLARLF